MTTAKTVKDKIRSIIEKANSITSKNDTDLTNAVGALIDGYGQGELVPEWDGSYTASDDIEEIDAHIIEVDELPTENIDENAVYRLVGQPTDILQVDAEGEMYFAVTDIEYPALIFLYRVKNRPTENIQVCGVNELHLYYVDSEDDVVAYVQLDQDDGTTTYDWFSFKETLLEEGSDNVWYGAIYRRDINNLVGPGWYVVLGDPSYHKYYNGNWINNIVPTGNITFTQNGAYEITDKETATISVPSVYIVQTLADLPQDVPTGSLAYVLGGGV